MRRAITLPNAGKEVKKTCGDGPILTSAAGFAAKDTTDAGATHFAVLRWNASPDDGSGEKDVVRYVLWRSTTPFAFGTFGDPYLSVAAGSATYEYFDQAMWSRGLRSDREGFALVLVLVVVLKEERRGLLVSAANAGLELGRARINGDKSLYPDSVAVFPDDGFLHREPVLRHRSDRLRHRGAVRRAGPAADLRRAGATETAQRATFGERSTRSRRVRVWSPTISVTS